MKPTHAILITLALVTLPACEGLDHILVSLKPTGTPTQYAPPRQYPSDTPVGDSLDVEVVRIDRTAIRITNRTARDLAGAHIWINDEYGSTINRLPVGGDTTITLNRFVNHHGERFPIGSLLEPEKTYTIVAADIIFDNQRHKILVRLPEEWQRMP